MASISSARPRKLMQRADAQRPAAARGHARPSERARSILHAPRGRPIHLRMGDPDRQRAQGQSRALEGDGSAVYAYTSERGNTYPRLDLSISFREPKHIRTRTTDEHGHVVDTLGRNDIAEVLVLYRRDDPLRRDNVRPPLRDNRTH